MSAKDIVKVQLNDFQYRTWVKLYDQLEYVNGQIRTVDLERMELMKQSNSLTKKMMAFWAVVREQPASEAKE